MMSEAFTPTRSLELDAADAALEEINAALSSLRAAYNILPDLPIGRAAAGAMIAGLAAVEHRRRVLEELEL
jgi:hypothetical protein